ncbi:ATPase [Candidatus Termititenax aidoneus]|uniref:ATPase n=1 Tax=Termititenax aidoneus TaxID=2218524 RepID=A0A388TCW3_TERA1|nr:ATPase [Candidatus Termititenax aidoneus]
MWHQRKIWPELQKDLLTTKQAMVITGPRRAGKTTTLKWLFEQIKSANKCFLDLENVGDRSIFEVIDYDNVVANLGQKYNLRLKQKMYIVIDEIQFLPNIASIVKYLYDHYDIKFILSGSSSYYLKNYFTESLSGRKFLYELFPLTFREYLEFAGKKYTFPPRNIYAEQIRFNETAFASLRNYYQDYLNFGGYPAVALAASREEKLREISEIYSAYINVDVKTLADFRSIADFRRLIELLAVRVGNRININELSMISGLARATIENYLEFLEQTYLVRTIPVESDSPAVRQRKAKKLYFVDNGIARINADLSGGQKFENAVSCQLAAQNVRISYYENKTGEIDFILRSPFGAPESQSVAIEVKETPTEADFTVLKKRAQRLGISGCYLVGREKSRKFNDYLWGGEL